LLSLPLAFKTGVQTIPAPAKYLSSDANKVARWQARLGVKTKPRIGLAWSGSAQHANDRNRSIALADLMQNLPDEFQYISIQKDVRELDARTLQSNSKVLNFANRIGDFGETAALCECLDLVISVDTSVAHMSAALGKRTWILLPFNPDWRWLLHRSDSPWYPPVTLYRQKRAGAWLDVLSQVKADLLQSFF
jgi:hypothetical protein